MIEIMYICLDSHLQACICKDYFLKDINTFKICLEMSVLYKAPENIPGQLISQRKISTKDYWSIFKHNTNYFTSEKSIDLIVSFILIQNIN